ncbi:MAG: signal recognition particle-docking protein FtsY [Alphaproteobacteria bacterium]|jgi:fused signal recognition particle receptor|tara:strand:- start:678 stop:1496 length:819 start_codon:yes stop_codon:yes gene_type:complete
MFFLKKFFSKKFEASELEDILYENGVEPEFADIIIETLSGKYQETEIKETLKKKIKEKLNIQDNLDWEFKPSTLYLIIGNNGSGKTTFIGKFINFLKEKRLAPSVIAADTFRAAAIEQLEHFASRMEVPFFKGENKEDPAAVVYKGIQNLGSKDSVLIIDTSGRQHNNKNLMDELKKISNIIIKNQNQFTDIKTLLTLDANIGLASKQIIEGFQNYIPIDGLVINKVDSNAKYGALLTIINNFEIPIIFEGYGEDIKELRMFEFEKYLDRLL